MLLCMRRILEIVDAHSGSFIYNIYDPSTRIPSNPRIITYGTIMGIESNDVRFRKVNDLVSLFYLHKIFCTNKLMKDDLMKEKNC